MLSAVEDMAEESTVEEHESASTKQVLVCFGERKRAVVFPCGANAEAEKDSLLSAIRKEFEDVLGLNQTLSYRKKVNCGMESLLISVMQHLLPTIQL